MSRRHSLRNSIGIAALIALIGPAAGWGAQRTFVSAASGNDSNSCSRLSPCRQFAAAMAQTDAGGEVVVLDSGGFGVVTVSQSVALVAPAGVHAAITGFSGNAITITATGSDVVVVRGLALSGLGGVNGISFQSGATLHVESCVLSGFSSFGLQATSVGGSVYVKDTISRQNGSGFQFQSSSTTISASLDFIRAEENSTHGVTGGANSLVTVTRGIAAGNGNTGFHTDGGTINVESSTTTFNVTGVFAANGTARAANSMITGNGTGVANGGGGSTISFGNNRLNGNTVNGTFTSTLAQQ